MAVRLCILLLLILQAVVAQEVIVAAAADLSPLQQPLSEAFHAQSGYSLRFSFGSSGMLARQIQNGAPFDVYLSANEEFVKDLSAGKRLIPNTVQVYATGRLGLWSENRNIKSLKDLLDASVHSVAIANPQHAPYGQAARQFLRNSGVWDAIQPKLVLAENVRQAFEFARTGNAEATLTAWTLIFDRGGILLPVTGYSSLVQSGGVVAGCSNERAARAFMRFLTSPQGQKILAASGLFPPNTSGRD
jgi:molybdate transport system substrate-binding protein